MVNAWIEFVKKYASENGLSYACALSTPACKASYQQQQTTNYKPQLNRIGALLRPTASGRRPTPAKIQQARDLWNQTNNLVNNLEPTDQKRSYMRTLRMARERIQSLLATA